MTTAPGVDVRQHDAAIKALLDAKLAPNKAWGYDDLPSMNGNLGDLPAIFAIVSIERTHADTSRMSRHASRSGWRLSVRWAGRSRPEAQWAEKRVTDALEGVRITVDGETSTAIEFDGSAAATYDDGRMVGLTEFTYVL